MKTYSVLFIKAPSEYTTEENLNNIQLTNAKEDIILSF